MDAGGGKRQWKTPGREGVKSGPGEVFRSGRRLKIGAALEQIP
jgi:hypothetical protein